MRRRLAAMAPDTRLLIMGPRTTAWCGPLPALDRTHLDGGEFQAAAAQRRRWPRRRTQQMTNSPMTNPSDNPWTSLEVVKLVVSVATPIVLATIGIYIHRVTKRFEHQQWRNQKLTEKRLQVYDALAPLLNDNLCYFTYLGTWKDRTPKDVVASKRTIDKQIHLAAPLFSEEFFSACMAFQELCFETYTGWGQDAKLKTLTTRRREASQWQPEWDDLFSDKTSDPELIRAAYAKILVCFKLDIGVHDGKSVILPGRVPANIR